MRALAGSGAPRASSSAATARAAARLPLPAGPCSRYACDGPPVGGRAEHGGGVRVGLEGGEGRHGAQRTALVAATGTFRRVARGRLITVEGLDGAGKTTLVDGLARALRALGQDVELLREPGGVVLSERIRALVKDPALAVDPRAEALLYAAARAQLVAERLEPLLAGGRWVLLDRFVDSSLAYQGAGRGLGVDDVRRLNAFATGDLRARPHAAAAHRPGRRARARRRPRRGRRPARARAARLLRRDRRRLRRARRGRAGALRGDRRDAAAALGRASRPSPRVVPLLALSRA